MATEARPRRRDGIEDELLSDVSLVIYSREKRRVLTLNATGAFVWDLCDGGQSIGAIVAEVSRAFPAAPDVDGDVRRLLDTLLEEDLIELAPPASEPADVPVTASPDPAALTSSGKPRTGR
jgi:hypothetical protein